MIFEKKFSYAIFSFIFISNYCLALEVQSQLENDSAPSKLEAKTNLNQSSDILVKDDFKQITNEDLKIKDVVKKTKTESFSKKDVLIQDVKNPTKFNGLPTKAIENVPGLAKQKNTTFINLKDAVQTAVVTNPDVLQSYKSFEAAVRDSDAAWGRYLPSIDLTATYGQDNRNDPLVATGSGRLGGSYERSQTSITLKQMLFDGFFTKTEVERLNRTSRARLFELEDVSNAVALEATKAYIDLLRFRKLTELTEDNYVAHKIIYEQLVIKEKAGVGKKSDVAQAKSRLALAEYNMNVEGANLHDIEARFQKVVGFLPPEDIEFATPVNKDLPSSINDAITYAQQNNPKLLATIEDALSQQALLDNRDAAFMPKVNFIVRAERGSNLNSFDGQHRNDVAEIVFNWNLFNGNSDINFKRKESAALEAAINRRDKFCRDIRLELEIAYNDIKKLLEQYNYLDARTISIEKARDAYRKQFEIGQRTLIDLLNTENELFEAKRLLTNVQNDIAFAYGRTHYQMGSILSTLGVTRYASTTTAPKPLELSKLALGLDVCPAEAPVPYKSNIKNLDSRARELMTAPKQDIPKNKSLDRDFKELIQEVIP